VGSNRGRARRELERRQKAEQARPPAPEPEQPLSYRRQEERAVRRGWLSEGDEYDLIIDRLKQVVRRDDPLGENDRYAIRAAGTLISADLRQQALDFQREQAAAEAYERAGAETTAAQTDPVDAAIFDWYGETCPCGLPAGECKEHPRARATQRPPEGDWRVWAYIAGRGAGKTRAGACWIQHRVETGAMKLGFLIAPTAADIRDVIVEGPSGLLAVASPACRPRFEGSKRRVVWPNGAWAICLSGEEPERARGPNVDTIWADELGCWKRAEATWNTAILALRAGTAPRALITTTPRRVPILQKIVGKSTTARTTDTTYANQAHLAPEFLGEILGMFEGSRLGRQEIYAEFLDTAEGVWFSSFDPAKHVSETAEYHPAFPVHLAIDCGASATTGAVWFQVRQLDAYRHRVTVFGDYCLAGAYTAKNAAGIKERSGTLPSGGKLDLVRVDPAAKAHTGIGPAAYTEYEKVFGRLLAKWPSHGVVDGLEFMELLLETGRLVIHPRCTDLIDAFKTYRKKERGGVAIYYPADNQSPSEDMIDALRGGIRDRFPEGSTPALKLTQRRMTGGG